VKIEKPERAIASFRSKKRSYWIKRTTTPPPPMPPIVAKAMMTIRTNVPTASMGKKGPKRL
jgi:hypothetical protein